MPCANGIAKKGCMEDLYQPQSLLHVTGVFAKDNLFIMAKIAICKLLNSIYNNETNTILV